MSRVILAGQMTISRPQGSTGGEYINLAFVDGLSRVQFLEVRVPLASFAEALTGLAYVPVDLEVRGLDRIGMTREHKTERVPFLGRGRADEAIAPFEIDGWTGSRRDYENHHKSIRTDEGEFQAISFERHVPTPNSEPSNV